MSGADRPSQRPRSDEQQRQAEAAASFRRRGPAASALPPSLQGNAGDQDQQQASGSGELSAAGTVNLVRERPAAVERLLGDFSLDDTAATVIGRQSNFGGSNNGHQRRHEDAFDTTQSWGAIISIRRMNSAAEFCG